MSFASLALLLCTLRALIAAAARSLPPVNHCSPWAAVIGHPLPPLTPQQAFPTSTRAPQPQQPSNFNRSILTDDHRPPSPPTHRGQLTPSLSAPPQLISQHYINPGKLYDPSIGPLEQHNGSPISSRRSPSAAARPHR
jgi:hypothetical protein